MTDPMQTIRKYVQEAHDYMEDGMSSYKWQQAYGFICKALAAITALDSLAEAPSDDVIELAQLIESRFHQGHYADDYNAIAALIQARDERIRGETLEECPYRKAKRFYCKDGNNTVAICTKPEATNEQ